jgi:GNAT superfamily N-acetyltransferase
LVYDAAPSAYSAIAGSPERAQEALEALWTQRGHSASFEHALVAVVDGRLAGVVIAFPERDRYRLHRALLRQGLAYVPRLRWPLIAIGLAQLVLATPRPPRDAYYVGTISVAWHARRRGVGSTLGHHAELEAAARGFDLIVCHTGAPHLPARSALERYGMRPLRGRRRGYVLYSKRVAGRPAA